MGELNVQTDQNFGHASDEQPNDDGLLNNGALRIALLFGSAAVAFALILTPIIDRGAGNVVGQRGMSAELDRIATGSTGRAGEYTIRRSVLQTSPTAVCIISKDGRQAGEC